MHRQHVSFAVTPDFGRNVNWEEVEILSIHKYEEHEINCLATE